MSQLASENKPPADSPDRDANPGAGGPGDEGWLARHSGAVRWISLALILASLIAVVRALPVEQAIARLQTAVDGLGPAGPAVYGGIYVAAAVLFVPGSALTLAAGAVFGLWVGILVVSIAATTAAALAFLIARYLARSRIEQAARSRPRFAAIDRAIAEGGWKVILLLRLSPVVPFSIGNYLFGLTGVRFWPYVLASWIGMLPGTAVYVYLGYVGAKGLSATAGEGGMTPLEWVLLGVGLVATIAVAKLLMRLARRELARYAGEQVDETAAADTPARPRRARPALVWGAAAIVAAGAAVSAHVFKPRLAGMFGPPPAQLQEAHEARPEGPRFDHSAFTEILQRHVADGGWVDYDALAADASSLEAYIESLATAPFDELGRNEKLAMLINGYNAFTLQLILENYPLDSIRDIPASKRWDDVRWRIGDHTWSLNQIEHEQIRPKFREPRIHFALVCAAVGCPPLRREAYTGDRIDEQLEDQTVTLHSDPRWFRYEPGAEFVHMTQLYDWYGGDFEQVAGSALEYAAAYSPALQSALEAGAPPRIKWIEYDWTLNSKEQAP